MIRGVTPGGVAASEDALYISDTGTHRIRKIELPANPAPPSWTMVIPAKKGSLRFPGAVAADISGNLYVIDGNEILKITAGGSSSLAGSLKDGSADGQGSEASFRNPLALAVDESGTIYVADTGNDALRMITKDGAVTTLAKDLHHPAGVTVTPEKRVFVADTDARTILEFTGNNVVRGKKLSPTFEVLSKGLDDPRALSADGSGNLWVADGNRIKRINAKGQVAVVAGSGDVGALDGWGQVDIVFFTEGPGFRRPRQRFCRRPGVRQNPQGQRRGSRFDFARRL